MTAEKVTEQTMLAMLAARHNEKAGNGEAYAFVTHVRNAAGFDASRTIDAIAMALWPSRGLIVDGFEIKCSRSDWLRELKKPEKAEAFAQLVDRFWLVVADRSIVQAGELPDGWGLLYAHGKSLRCGQEPAFLHPYDAQPDGRTILERRGGKRPLPPGFGRSYLAALLRSACRRAAVEDVQITAAREEGFAAGEQSVKQRSKSYEDMWRELADQVREFESAAGIQIRGYNWRDQDPKVVGEAVQSVLNGQADVDSLRTRLQRIVTDAEGIAEYARSRPAMNGEEAA